MRTVTLGQGRVADLNPRAAAIVAECRTRSMHTRATLQAYTAMGGGVHTEELLDGWAAMEAQVMGMTDGRTRAEREVERLHLLPTN